MKSALALWALGVLGCCVMMVGGCAASVPDGSADYVFVYLKTGPKSAEKTPAERAEVFKGHMANMQRLAEEKKLIIAGPFDKPRDKSWRGIFVMDAPSVEQAQEWAATDPGVVAGVFVLEFRPMRGSVELRKTLELEKQLPKKETKPGEPPANIRGYVMVTTGSVVPAHAIASSELANKVVWSGAFPTTPPCGAGSGPYCAGGAVFIIDSTSAADVRRVVDSLPNASDVGVDGWWSTTSLEKLPREAAFVR